MKVSDERLEELVCSIRKNNCSIYEAPSIYVALEELLATRRRDAAIEQALREDRSRAITVEAHGAGFSATIDDEDDEDSIYNFAQADTLSAVLSALATELSKENDA